MVSVLCLSLFFFLGGGTLISHKTLSYDRQNDEKSEVGEEVIHYLILFLFSCISWKGIKRGNLVSMGRTEYYFTSM